MRFINTFASIHARIAGTFIDINLTSGTREASRAEALGPVVDSHAEATVVTDTFWADHILTFIFA